MDLLPNEIISLLSTFLTYKDQKLLIRVNHRFSTLCKFTNPIKIPTKSIVPYNIFLFGNYPSL